MYEVKNVHDECVLKLIIFTYVSLFSIIYLYMSLITLLNEGDKIEFDVSGY